MTRVTSKAGCTVIVFKKYNCFRSHGIHFFYYRILTLKKVNVAIGNLVFQVVEPVDQDYTTLQNETTGATFCSGGGVCVCLCGGGGLNVNATLFSPFSPSFPP